MTSSFEIHPSVEKDQGQNILSFDGSRSRLRRSALEADLLLMFGAAVVWPAAAAAAIPPLPGASTAQLDPVVKLSLSCSYEERMEVLEGLTPVSLGKRLATSFPLSTSRSTVTQSTPRTCSALIACDMRRCHASSARHPLHPSGLSVRSTRGSDPLATTLVRRRVRLIH